MSDADGQWQNPTIEGSLVRLRPFAADDIDALLEMMNDPVGKDLTATSESFTIEQIRSWYLTRDEHTDRIDVAIVERATGELAGEAVLNEYEPADRTCSFRISLRGPGWFGRGLGSEATALIVGHGFEVLGLDRITLEVLARNPRARRAYEKAGFTTTAETFEDGEDWVQMVIVRP